MTTSVEKRIRLSAERAEHLRRIAEAHQISEDQLIGLRFAGDDEVVALAKTALEENLSRKQIKERIRNWRADEWRA